MTANPQIDQLAAEVRKRLASRSPADRRNARNTANRIADDFRRDLPDIADELMGAVLLRAANLALSIWQGMASATALDVSNALAAAGERLYHHPQLRAMEAAEPADAEPEAAGLAWTQSKHSPWEVCDCPGVTMPNDPTMQGHCGAEAETAEEERATREQLVHDDPALAQQIRDGMAAAERGETVDRGSFAQYLDEEESAP